MAVVVGEGAAGLAAEVQPQEGGLAALEERAMQEAGEAAAGLVPAGAALLETLEQLAPLMMGATRDRGG